MKVTYKTLSILQLCKNLYKLLFLLLIFWTYEKIVQKFDFAIYKKRTEALVLSFFACLAITTETYKLLNRINMWYAIKIPYAIEKKKGNQFSKESLCKL